MRNRILVINGHPDPRPERLCAALCDAYADGARQAGREVRRLAIGSLDIPQLRSAEAFTEEAPCEDARQAQVAIAWADHVVIVHPLWLGSAPAALKAFFEQVFRYGFAVPPPGTRSLSGLLKGRSARLIVTMGMPALAYRLLFGGFGVRGFARGILGLSGFKPVRITLLGQVDESGVRRASWVASMRRLGRAAL
jgi:putative NADPH-quinone reductase